QFELAGSTGIADGRYPVREPASADAARGETELVLVAETLGAPAPARRRLRRSKPRDADSSEEAEVPLTRLTVIEAVPIEGEGDEWLERMRKDEDMRDALVDRALACATRALAAWRVAAADASIADPSLDGALAVRVGFGEGDGLVEGHWAEAIDLSREAHRRTRGEALRPQERMAALLGGRDAPLACEELLLRARSDLDAGREREGALQLRVALEALLADREALSQPRQAEDLTELDGRRKITGEAANEALQGPLRTERVAEVAETLAVCERVLRRRAAHG
ncbi:MAG: hypothetical protein WKF62_06975, partial [Solirubrobacterales bacterium]